MADPRLILHNINTLGNIADKQERVQDIGTVIRSSPCTEDHESLLGGLALLGSSHLLWWLLGFSFSLCPGSAISGQPAFSPTA